MVCTSFGGNAVSYARCEKSYQRFKIGNFNLENDDSRCTELEKSLDGNHGSIPENGWLEWQNRIRVLPSMLWDFRGIIRYEPLPPGRTITAEYCQNRSTNSYEQLKQKRPFTGQGMKCVILQRDDARPRVAENTGRFMYWNGKCCRVRHTLQT